MRTWSIRPRPADIPGPAAAATVEYRPFIDADPQVTTRPSWFRRVRDWNRRTTTWSLRHPWAWAAIYATSFTATYWTAWWWVNDFTLDPWVYAVQWVALVAFGGLITRAKARRSPRDPVTTRPTDLTLRGDNGPGMDADGRRWRSDAP